MATENSSPSRLSHCPAWLRYWSPCAEHEQGSRTFIDNAILGWREAQKRHAVGSAPSPRATAEQRYRWHALETLRNVIRNCDDCRCQTASLAAQAALEDGRKPSGRNYCLTYKGVADSFTGCSRATYSRTQDPDFRAWMQRSQAVA